MSRAVSLKSQSSQKQRQCEVLGELFCGPTGSVSVGRMLRGTELGRLVLLRQVPDQHLNNISASIDMARSVAHPSLLKVVGRVETPDTTFIASEYITGVCLMELLEAAMARGQRIDTDIAVRIILDALLAAARGKTLLRENTGSLVSRSIFPDTVWIAEFGETMLTEVGIASSLVADYREQSADALPDEEEIDDDVAAAGAELLKLLTNQPLEEAEMTLPIAGELASIVARAVNPGASNRFKTAQEMADAMSALPSHLVATEKAVGNTVMGVMASVLAVRHPRRLMSVASPKRPGGEDATCVFQDSFDFVARARESEPGASAGSEMQARSRPSSRAAPGANRGVTPAHPAYAFLAKHGLLEHADNLSEFDDERTHVIRQHRPAPSPAPEDDSGDDPTGIVSTEAGTRESKGAPALAMSLQVSRSSNAPAGQHLYNFAGARWLLALVCLLLLALLAVWLLPSAAR